MSNTLKTESERSELSAIFTENYDAVYRFLLARSGSPHQAEEAASDTFAEAARLFAQGRGNEVTLPWLITVARRRLVDRWRANERYRDRVAQYRNLLPTRSGSATDSAELVLRSLQTLPERQRAALTLRYLDEYSVSEVAVALQCPYQAAESLLARARRSFARAYMESK